MEQPWWGVKEVITFVFVTKCLKLKFVDFSHSPQQSPPRWLTKRVGVVVLFDPLPESFTPALKCPTCHSDGAIDEVTGQAEVNC